MKYCDCHDPLIPAFVSVLMSAAFAPSEPLIPAFVSVLMSAAFAPNDPLIASLASELLIMLTGEVPNAPSQAPGIDACV